MGRLTMLLVGATIFAAFGAGCGDDGGAANVETTITTSSLSKAALVKKADAICDRGRRKALEYQTPNANFSEQESVALLIEESLAPAFRKVVDEVRALGAPAGDEGDIEAYLNAMTAATTGLEENPPPKFTGIEKAFKQSARLARAYGIPRCAYALT